MAGMRDATAKRPAAVSGSEGSVADPVADPIADALRALYRDAESEPLPPQLTELLARLAAEESR